MSLYEDQNYILGDESEVVNKVLRVELVRTIKGRCGVKAYKRGYENLSVKAYTSTEKRKSLNS